MNVVISGNIDEMKDFEIGNIGKTCNARSKPVYQRDSWHYFVLLEEFVEKYKGKQPDWGTIGYVTYKRTYSRAKNDGTTEEYWETVRRVVEGCYTIQKTHCHFLDLPWNDEKAQRSAQRMFDKIWKFKFLPPGRGLWIMGTEHVYKHGSMALNNCGFVSTKNLDLTKTRPFEFMMDASMLGVGVGFDTKGAGSIAIKEPADGTYTFKVPDSRQGWIDGLRLMLLAFFDGERVPTYDFSLIRPKGTPIKGFGGMSSGSEPLMYMYASIHDLLLKRVGKAITSVDIVDIMNLIGKCVVSGNVRRSAQIALGLPSDKDYVQMKDPDEHGDELMSHRWASNNSIVVDPNEGFDYTEVARSIAKNGEPGIIWLENARKYSRMIDEADWKDKNVCGVNPCGEQSLESFELCVSGDTRVQTLHGCYKIADIVNKVVSIWNGKKWSKTTVVMTSPSSELVRVHFSDGSYLDTTRYHEFSARGKGYRSAKKKRADKLEIGDAMPEWTLGEIGCISVEHSYEYGLFQGDGFIDAKGTSHLYPMISLHGKKLELAGNIAGTLYKEQTAPGYNDPFARVNMKDILDVNKCVNMRGDGGLDDWIFEMDRDSILNFIAGWIDTDGNVQKDSNTWNFRIFGPEMKIRDLQLLLRRVGINHATISLWKEPGEKIMINGHETTRTKSLWCCTIPSYESGGFPTRLKTIPPAMIGSRYAPNNAHPDGKMIDRARKQKVTRIEYLGIEKPVYCFNEPDMHMGVFGNTLTYQCCLVETFPSRHESYEEFEETLKLAYLYAKSVTLIRTHWKETNAVMLKNRRIGTSISGIIDAFARHGRRQFISWLQKGYAFLKDVDDEYSNWLCIPKSVKITTVKPSGTTSLLAGVSPGIHYPHSRFYIRRIRMDIDSDLLHVLHEAGYHIEKDKYGSDGTMIVSFPVKTKDYCMGKREASMEMQLMNAIDIQRYWSDNQVSITVTFNKDEANRLKDVLQFCEDKLKGVSFLPLNEHGYVQAPYEEITEERYNEMVSKVSEIQIRDTHEAGIGVSGCDGEQCNL